MADDYDAASKEWLDEHGWNDPEFLKWWKDALIPPDNVMRYMQQFAFGAWQAGRAFGASETEKPSSSSDYVESIEALGKTC